MTCAFLSYENRLRTWKPLPTQWAGGPRWMLRTFFIRTPPHLGAEAGRSIQLAGGRATRRDRSAARPFLGKGAGVAHDVGIGHRDDEQGEERPDRHAADDDPA